MVVDKNIIQFIPQKPPFVMIGELLFADDTITKTSFRIDKDNVLVIDDVFAEAGVLENIAQTAAVGKGFLSQQANVPVSIGYIGAIKNFEIFGLPKIEDIIITEVTVKDQVFNVTIVEGKCWCNNTLIAQCEMKIFIDQEA
jgi:predicted hotdog family 3-hydroxylacyl-ACP dehydratase